MSDESAEETWHEEEMRMANERKAEWLDRRGKVVTWFLKPWPAPYWIETTWLGIVIGLLIGLLGAVVIYG